MATDKQIKKQSDEFKAAFKFEEATRILRQTAIVDDDYPSVRYSYEMRLQQLLEAMYANGRFDDHQNRYGLIVHED